MKFHKFLQDAWLMVERWLTEAIRLLFFLAIAYVLMPEISHNLRLAIFATGVGAILNWISWKCTYYVAPPLARWTDERRRATELLERDFQTAEVALAISIERSAAKVFADAGLVVLDSHGVEVTPRLDLLLSRDWPGPIFAVKLPAGITPKGVEDQRAKLETGFGCPIDIRSFLLDCSDIIQIQFRLRDSHDPALQDPTLLKTGMGHSEIYELITSCQRFWFKSWLPIYVARTVRRQNEN